MKSLFECDWPALVDLFKVVPYVEIDYEACQRWYDEFARDYYNNLPIGSEWC